MKQAVKTALYAAFLMLIASLFGYSIGHGRYLSSRQYMQSVVSKGMIEQLSQRLSEQYTKELGPTFDATRFKTEMDKCMHRRIDTWLNGNDPRLNQNITMDGVKDFASEFVLACIDDLSNGIR